ncbi:polyketide cyclase [Pedobacter yulinensis]|uniref:Polyketide cyclase n=1 Tax=Pedobacter yulinensis TaxID=2126353 RepID=A0A2T3HS46_9SPHI|nr:SRPBCC family protein [Pedobacter yulinensis]PST85290.1 polyketide cyclase [Pedobacter yulinensis]
MTTSNQNQITISAIINAPVEKVWHAWSEPVHIKKWNSASDDWHTPHAENDLRTGGTFSSRMEAKDGSMGFDFSGKYDAVEENKLISYTMEDGRSVQITFNETEGRTEVIESFDPEQQNSREMQQEGWQAILDNFKLYVEQL